MSRWCGLSHLCPPSVVTNVFTTVLTGNEMNGEYFPCTDLIRPVIRLSLVLFWINYCCYEALIYQKHSFPLCFFPSLYVPINSVLLWSLPFWSILLVEVWFDMTWSGWPSCLFCFLELITFVMKLWSVGNIPFCSSMFQFHGVVFSSPFVCDNIDPDVSFQGGFWPIRNMYLQQGVRDFYWKIT